MSETYIPQSLDINCFESRVSGLKVALGVQLRNGVLSGFGPEYHALHHELEELHGSLKDVPFTVESLKPVYEQFKRLETLSGHISQ